MRRSYLWALTALGLAGCATEIVDPPEYFVEQQWTSGIARLGRSLTPVYPPSEDYQVGDIYAVGNLDNIVVDPAVRAFVPSAVRLGTSSRAVADLHAIYANRLKLPHSVIDGSGATANLKVGTEFKATSAKDERRESGMLTPTPILALPAFTIASGTVDKFGASFASGAFGLLFGGASQKDTLLSISIEAGETYGLDVITADRELSEFCSGGKCAERNLLRYLNRTVAHNTGITFVNAKALMVTRVYMTRKINYNYTFSSAQAFEAAATAADLTANAAAQTAVVEHDALSNIVKSLPTAAADPAKASADQARNQVMIALVNDLGANLNKLADSKQNGAFFVHASYQNNSVTLTQVFARPVVIAYNALWLEDDQKSPKQGPSPEGYSTSQSEGPRIQPKSPDPFKPIPPPILPLKVAPKAI